MANTPRYSRWWIRVRVMAPHGGGGTGSSACRGWVAVEVYRLQHPAQKVTGEDVLLTEAGIGRRRGGGRSSTAAGGGDGRAFVGRSAQRNSGVLGALDCLKGCLWWGAGGQNSQNSTGGEGITMVEQLTDGGVVARFRRCRGLEPQRTAREASRR
jgi:hypothetical protein